MLDRLRLDLPHRMPYLIPLLPLLWILHPLLVSRRFFLSEEGDSLLVQYPLYHAFSVSMNGGLVPMWNQLLAGGLPLMATGDVGVIHPLNLILFRYLEPYLAWELAVLLAIGMNLVFMHLYLRARGSSVLAASLGATCFALGGFSVGHLGNLAVLQAMSMLPLTLLFSERYLRLGRLVDAALCSAPLAMAALAGSYRVGLAILLALVCQVLLGLLEPAVPSPAEIRRRAALVQAGGGGSGAREGMRMAGLGSLATDGTAVESIGRRLLRQLAIIPIAVLLTGLLAAPQLLLSWDFLPITEQAAGYAALQAQVDALQPSQLWLLLEPLLQGNPFRGTWLLPVKMGETLLYGGLVAALLALLAPFALAQGDRRVRLPLVLFLLGLLLALGPATPLFELFRTVLPLGQLLKGPGIFGLLAQFGLASLTSLGLDFVLSRLEFHPHPLGQRFMRILPWLCLGVTALDLGYHGAALSQWVDESVVFEDLESDTAIPALGYYRLFSVPGRPGAEATGAPTMSSDAVNAYKDRRALLWRNTQLIYRKASVGANVSLMPRWQRWLEKQLLDRLKPDGQGRLVADNDALQLLRFLGVRVLLTYFEPSHPDLVLLKNVAVKDVASPVHLYGLADGAPRAYLARNVRRCSEAQALQRIFLGNFGPGQDPCVLETDVDRSPLEYPSLATPDAAGTLPPGTLLDSSASDQGRLVVGLMEPAGRGETFLEVKIEVLHPAFLVVRDGYAPGWFGAVDGVETPLFPVDLMYRAVRVPEGKHTVRMEYRPRGLREGLVLNMLGLVTIALFYLLGRGPAAPPVDEPEDNHPVPSGDAWYQ